MLYRSYAAVRTIKRRIRLSTFLACVIVAFFARTSAPASGMRLDWAASGGPNYERAEFRFWHPDGGRPVQAVVVLVPGSNEDGRPLIEDAHWQAFAARHNLALIGCNFVDKSHPQMYVEAYADASKGSGQALVDALAEFGSRLDHPGLAQAPMLLWGMSAGGEFNYEFVAWRPDRVAAFIVNKGGFYYSALLSPEARRVPGLMFVGGRDLEARQDAIRGLFAMNRRAGALWALIEEPGAAHVVARSREIAEQYFDELIALRLGPPSTANPAGLRALADEAGFSGDPKTRATQKIAARHGDDPVDLTSWLPTERMARLWEAASKGQLLPE
jgi:poly(3-hydroxybutyrate) depolymerase